MGLKLPSTNEQGPTINLDGLFDRIVETTKNIGLVVLNSLSVFDSGSQNSNTSSEENEHI